MLFKPSWIFMNLLLVFSTLGHLTSFGQKISRKKLEPPCQLSLSMVPEPQMDGSYWMEAVPPLSLSFSPLSFGCHKLPKNLLCLIWTARRTIDTVGSAQFPPFPHAMSMFECALTLQTSEFKCIFTARSWGLAVYKSSFSREWRRTALVSRKKFLAGNSNGGVGHHGYDGHGMHF